MIIPDINLIIYAYNADLPQHAQAQAWWERLLSGEELVALPWVVVLAFIRLTTSAHVFPAPLKPRQAIEVVRSWFGRPNVQSLEPSSRHLDLIANLMGEIGLAGNLSTDIHLAAMALENRCTLHSNDRDFGRFSGLRWVNPLEHKAK